MSRSRFTQVRAQRLARLLVPRLRQAVAFILALLSITFGVPIPTRADTPIIVPILVGLAIEAVAAVAAATLCHDVTITRDPADTPDLLSPNVESKGYTISDTHTEYGLNFPAPPGGSGTGHIDIENPAQFSHAHETIPGMVTHETADFGYFTPNVPAINYNMEYRADVLHPDLQTDRRFNHPVRFVNYRTVRRTTFALNVVNVPSPREFVIHLNIPNLQLHTTNIDSTQGRVLYDFNVQTQELGQHFSSTVTVNQGQATVVQGNIPGSAFTLSPGHAALQNYSTDIHVPIPPGTSILNFVVNFQTYGEGRNLGPISVPAIGLKGMIVLGLFLTAGAAFVLRRKTSGPGGVLPA